MTTAAVILAGERGTRSAGPRLAKLAQEFEETSTITLHVRLLDGTPDQPVLVVTDHLGEQLQALCDALTSTHLPIRHLNEKPQEGTVDAPGLAAAHTEADEFVVTLGNIFMSFRVAEFLTAWRSSLRDVAVIAHRRTYPADCHAVSPDPQDRAQVLAKSKSRDAVSSMPFTDRFTIIREDLRRYGGCRGIGYDPLPAAAHLHGMCGKVNSHYFAHSGTVGRLACARADYCSGAFHRRATSAPQPAPVLDRYAAINPALLEIHDTEVHTLVPEVAQAIWSGITVVAFSRLPRLAKWLITLALHQATRARMDRLLRHSSASATFLSQSHHLEDGYQSGAPSFKIPDSCRKPADVLAHVAVKRQYRDLVRFVMVGHTDRDERFANADAITFVDVTDRRGQAPDHWCEATSADDIRSGIMVAT